MRACLENVWCDAPHRATGSGKTSLLNALAGRLPKGGLLEGEVRSGISRQSVAAPRVACCTDMGMQLA